MKPIRLIISLTILLSGVLTACAPAPQDAPSIVQQYYEAINSQQLDTAMTFVADDAVFVNPYGTFTGREAVRASLQQVMDDGVTFDLSNFRDTEGRVVYDYEVMINGEVVETGDDGLTVVEAGKITLDGTESNEWAAYIHHAAFTIEANGFSGPASLPSGWTEISLTNNTQGGYNFQLVKLEGGKTIQDLRTAAEADGENMPEWATPAGGPNAPDPGASTSAIVNLEPGDYAAMSIIPDADGVPGFSRGWLTALTVTEAAGEATREPEGSADLRIDLTEFALGVSGALTAGPHVIRINNQGTQQHEAYLVRLNEGVTVDQYLNTPPTEPPPAVGLGGITGIMPGAHQYVSLWLEPGHYALFCFLPDPASHAPHFALGMIQEFTVN
jgi:ketosteroid isomerase-like protein